MAAPEGKVQVWDAPTASFKFQGIRRRSHGRMPWNGLLRLDRATATPMICQENARDAGARPLTQFDNFQLGSDT